MTDQFAAIRTRIFGAETAEQFRVLAADILNAIREAHQAGHLADYFGNGRISVVDTIMRMIMQAQIGGMPFDVAMAMTHTRAAAFHAVALASNLLWRIVNPEIAAEVAANPYVVNPLPPQGNPSAPFRQAWFRYGFVTAFGIFNLAVDILGRVEHHLNHLVQEAGPIPLAGAPGPYRIDAAMDEIFEAIMNAEIGAIPFIYVMQMPHNRGAVRHAYWEAVGAVERFRNDSRAQEAANTEQENTPGPQGNSSRE